MDQTWASWTGQSVGQSVDQTMGQLDGIFDRSRYQDGGYRHGDDDGDGRLIIVLLNMDVEAFGSPIPIVTDHRALSVFFILL